MSQVPGLKTAEGPLSSNQGEEQVVVALQEQIEPSVRATLLLDRPGHPVQGLQGRIGVVDGGAFDAGDEPQLVVELDARGPHPMADTGPPNASAEVVAGFALIGAGELATQAGGHLQERTPTIFFR